MKTKTNVIIGYILILLFLMVTGCGHQDLSTIQEKENVETEENGDEVTVKADMLIRSEEEAREAMQAHLLKKYGENYVVKLPSRNENGDFSAVAYDEKDKKNIICVVAEVFTGECKDDGYLKVLDSFLQEVVTKKSSSVWDNVYVQVSCDFWNKVPKVDRMPDEDPQTVLQEEEISSSVYVMVNKDNFVMEDEALLIQKIINTEELEGLLCDLNVYYVTSEIYHKALAEMQDGKLMVSTSCAADYEHSMNMFLKIQIKEDYLEEIINGFRK